MLRVRLEREVSNYFFDNGSLTEELRIAIEELIFTEGIPSQGSHYVDPEGTHVWSILGHIVIYSIEENWINVDVVMPAS